MDDAKSKALIELNKRLIELENSKSSYIKRNVMLTLKMISGFQLKELFSLLYLKISGKNAKINREIEGSERLKKRHPNSFNGNFVVYTCIIGGYDKPVEPLYVNPNCRFVLITDNCELEPNSAWQKLVISPEDFPGLKPNEINRYIKLHPNVYFPEYQYSIYIDGNIQAVADLMPLINQMGDSILGIHMHDRRDCAYEEASTFKSLKKMQKHIPDVTKQMKEYEKEGFPHHYGLFENPILIRKHNDCRCIRIMDEWWKQLEMFSMRDQLSLPYVLWKLKIDNGEIEILGNDLRKNPRFRQYRHL